MRDASEAGRDRRTGLGIFLGFLALYLKTLCPTVYFGDSGEIVTAIWSGGIIHPPGYPLLGLLGRLFLKIIPFGEPALRVGVLVALAGAATLPVLFALCRQAGLGRRAALAATLCYGLGGAFWSQTVRVEVYSLHALLSALCLLFALRYRRSGAPAHLLTAALSFGLGLGHHLTIVLLLPALLALCGKRLWTDPGAWARVGLCALVILGTGPLLYVVLLPLWARDASLHNWSNPDNAERLLVHVSARIYRSYLQVPAGPQIGAALGRNVAAILASLPLPLCLIPPVGVWLLWRRDRAIALGLGLCPAACALYNYHYTIQDISGYYLAALLCAVVFLGEALDRLDDLLAQRARGPVAGWALTLAIPAFLVALNFPRCDLSRATFVREFARQKLEDCLPDSVLLAQGDQDHFPLNYVHEALGVRPDVLILGREYLAGAWADYELDGSFWYLHRLRAQGVDAPLPPPGTKAQRRSWAGDGYFRLLLEGPLKDRPLATTFLGGSGPAEGALPVWLTDTREAMPSGLIVQFYPKDRIPTLTALLERNQAIWSRRDLPDMGTVDRSGEMDPDYIPHQYVSMLINYGYLYEVNREPAKAEKVYQAAAQFAPNDPRPRASLQSLGAPGR